MQSFVDTDFTPNESVSTEQLTVLSLLSSFFTGRSNWSFSSPDQPDFGGGLGGMGEPADTSGVKIGYIFDDEYPLSLATYDESEFREGLKQISNMMIPIEFSGLVDTTDISGLQQLIDEKINSQNSTYRVTVRVEPITLSIRRSTQSDIDALLVGGIPPHVDMFDTLLEMLPHHSKTLDGNDYAPAWYDPRTDEILFKSHYGIFKERIDSLSEETTSVTVSQGFINDTSTNYLFSYQINDDPIVNASFDGSSFAATSLADYIVWHMPDKEVFKYDFDRHPSDNEALVPFWIDSRSDGNGDYVFAGLDGTEIIPNVSLFKQSNTLKFLLTPSATDATDMVKILFGGEVEIKSAYASSGTP